MRYTKRMRTKNAMYLDASSLWSLREKNPFGFMVSMKQSNKKVMEYSAQILILCPYPHDTAGSQRFRFEQYLGVLELAGIHVTQRAFLTTWGWGVVYKNGFTLLKIIATLWGFVRRCALLTTLYKYDLVMIHREASPIGPPIFEWWISRVAKKKVVYDFDDAIWLYNSSNPIIKTLKNPLKTRRLCAWADLVFAGNQYLANFAGKQSENVVVMPTTIDTDLKHNQTKNHHNNAQKSDLCIGWTGSHSTLKYLKHIEGVLSSIQDDYGVNIKIIADRAPNNLSFDFDFCSWNKESEIEDLLEFDIGLMPLPEESWAEGKCGFKALQYQSLGIPCVVSPVGANKNIVLPEKTGKWATTEKEWVAHITELIESPSLRQEMGSDGRKHVEELYSVKSRSPLFIQSLLDLL